MAKIVKTPAPAKPTVTKGPSTQDKGVVHIGGGYIRYATTADKGKVHIGGGYMRF